MRTGRFAGYLRDAVLTTARSLPVRGLFIREIPLAIIKSGDFFSFFGDFEVTECEERDEACKRELVATEVGPQRTCRPETQEVCPFKPDFVLVSLPPPMGTYQAILTPLSMILLLLLLSSSFVFPQNRQSLKSRLLASRRRTTTPPLRTDSPICSWRLRARFVKGWVAPEVIVHRKF